MIQLYIFECKKIFKQKITCILLVLLAGMSVCLLNNRVNYRSEESIYLDETGSIMSEEEVKKEVGKAKQIYTGEMDEAWFAKLEADYDTARYMMTQRLVDFAKMEEAYGKDWYEDFIQNKEVYYHADAEPVGDEIKPAYYYDMPLPSFKEDIYYNTIASLYLNYGEMMMRNKPWNSEDGTFGVMYSMHNNEPVPMQVYANSSLSKEELLYLKDFMNEKTFYYGDSGNLFEFLEMLSPVGVFTMLWMLLISSNLVNKERSQGSLELLSSTVFGRKRLFIAKVGACITSGILALFFMVFTQAIYMAVTGGFGDWNVNSSEGLNMVSIFTYGEGFLISLLVLLLGVFVISILGTTISIFIKSSYASLAVMALLIFALQLSDFVNLNPILFPMGFMDTPAVAVRGFVISLFDHVYLIWKTVYVVWIPLCMLLLFISYRTYTSRKYNRIA